MKYCTNCGEQVLADSKFCTSCGEKLASHQIEKPNEAPKKVVTKPSKSQSSIDKINKKITVQNSQSTSVKRSWYVAGFFLLIVIIAIFDFDSLPIHPALAFISFFLFICSIVVAWMFRSREKKMQTLISGESLLAEWTLSKAQKKAYVNYLFKNEKGKNIVILLSIAAISFVVFGIFILVIDEGKLAMTGVWFGLNIFLSLFAFGMPYYYKMKNANGDGNILIGAKYAYINGYFHNWDFILSGISKVKIIQEPFYGINLVYYYTDRTFRHSEELFIPANEDLDLEDLIHDLKNLNKK